MMVNGKLSHGQRKLTMKVKEIIKKMYQAILNHNQKKEKKLWFKAIKKSLKHKRTQIIR
jgi:hypothetical protein